MTALQQLVSSLKPVEAEVLIFWFQSDAQPRMVNIKDLFLGKVDVNKDESAKIDNGIKRFILEIIEKHGPIARRLCNKDPFALKYMKDLSEWYPNSKFIYMIRDGRSVAHSIITRKVTITGIVLLHFYRIGPSVYHSYPWGIDYAG